jgi:hypothetical protein
MTSQTIPRGHHPGPQRGEVLGKEPKLGAPFGFQCQGKTQGETKVLTSMLVEEGSLGSQQIGVFKGLVNELVLDASARIIGSYVVTQF